MPVNRPVPPPEVTAALLKGLREYTSPRDPLLSLPPEAWLALKVFSLQIEDIIQKGGLAAAKPAGWRFLVDGGEASGGPAAADVAEAATGGQPRMISLLRDPLITNAIQSVHIVERMEQWKSQEYELRVVRIPGILVEAVWLFSPVGEPDWVIPTLRRSRQIKRLWPYPTGEFFEIAQSASERCLEFDKPYTN
ncbi:MAG: hypothetical protein JNN08_02540 [Bryobacterales bacterium]|nr:hypothetical protein [Bryobacterales bacterium]